MSKTKRKKYQLVGSGATKPNFLHQPGPQVVKGKKSKLTNHQRVIMGRCLRRHLMPSDYVRMYSGGEA